MLPHIASPSFPPPPLADTDGVQGYYTTPLPPTDLECPLRRCQGALGCVCPAATCSICSTSGRLPTASPTAHRCGRCLRREAMLERAPTPKHSWSPIRGKGEEARRRARQQEAPKQKKHSPAELFGRFQLIDDTGLGKIRSGDLLRVLQGVDANIWTEKVVAKLMESMGPARDGTCGVKEFARYLESAEEDALRDAFTFALNALMYSKKRELIATKPISPTRATSRPFTTR
mmetsp:Transcript_27606/g.76435  ORF Transcript_27606/g.76435 Transcript_27606/m.76435 type:complete len:231 (+) Transcript_27606:23-715(+)